MKMSDLEILQEDKDLIANMTQQSITMNESSYVDITKQSTYRLVKGEMSFIPRNQVNAGSINTYNLKVTDKYF